MALPNICGHPGDGAKAPNRRQVIPIGRWRSDLAARKSAPRAAGNLQIQDAADHDPVLR